MPSISTRKRIFLYGSTLCAVAIVFSFSVVLLVDDLAAGFLNNLEDHEFRGGSRGHADLDDQLPQSDGGWRIQFIVDAYSVGLFGLGTQERTGAPYAVEKF